MQVSQYYSQMINGLLAHQQHQLARMRLTTLQIEFPSILLPPDITSGSIVDVNVARNFTAEERATKAFTSLQSQLLSEFGSSSPSPPVLRCRNATQTSVVLEWDSIVLASSKLRSLSLYRNGNKAGAIPRPLEMTSTKISGLAVDTEYTFNLVLKTSAGMFSSERLVVKTHKMTNLTGITITPGHMDSADRAELETTVSRIGAKFIEQIRIDTTHFVCTEGRGPAWERARDMNIPIVTPDWVKACEREGRLAGVRGYYLDADPKLRQSSSLTTNQTNQNLNPASAVPERARQDSMAISPMTGGPGQPPSGGSGGAARSMAVPSTQITPPTPETSNEEFRSRIASGQQRSEQEGAAAKPETVLEQSEAEAAERESADAPSAPSASVPKTNGAEQEDGSGDLGSRTEETTTSVMPGGASLTAQHSDITEESAKDGEDGDEGEGQDFDEVKL